MTRCWTRRQALLSLGTAAIAGCSGVPDPPVALPSTDSPPSSPTPIPEPDLTFSPVEDWTVPSDAPTTSVEISVLIENLEIPWDLSFAGNGDVFITERVGRIRRFTAGELRSVLSLDDAIDAESVPPGHDEQPWWVKGGEGGTLGLAVHPDYPDVSILYVYYTASVRGERENRIARFDLSADDPASTEVVLVDGIPAANIHNGGRLTFGPEGRLWATIGESGERTLASDPGNLAGSVIRLTANGDPAPGNPDIPDGDPRIFTYGHRNPQGLAWLPDGTPIVSEHGPAGKDEISRLVPGANYGWPTVRTREEYEEASGRIHPPLANSDNTAWAPTGCQFYTGDGVPSWRNRLVVGGLRSQQVLVGTLTPPDSEPPPVGDGQRFDAAWFDGAYTLTVHPVLRNELGRVRHLEQGPDGALYAITSNRDGRARQPFPRDRDDVLVQLEAAE